MSQPGALRDAGARHFGQDAYGPAASAFQAAAEAYEQAGDPQMAAEMRNNQSVALLKAGEPEGALAACEGTEAVFAEAEDHYRQALALGNQAAALQEMKSYEEAESRYRQSAEILDSLGEHELRADVMRSISEIQLRTGRQLAAVASMHAGLEGVKKPTFKQRLVKKLLEMPFNRFYPS